MHRRRLAASLAGLVVLMGSAVSQQSFAQTLIDYDTDNDNLIEVDSLAKLNAIRYDLVGDGTASDANYATAFPTPATSMGCPATCEGYELMANLDFDTDGDGEITAADGVLSWGSGNGWQPIGTFANPFTTEFHGNGHTISHLFIYRTGTNYVGLFGVVDTGAIRSVGLIGVDVTGFNDVGGLAGRINQSSVHASYVTGEVSGDDRIGGLAGQILGEITASYATGVVSGDDRIGGLAGANGGTINASYAASEVSGDDLIGGLVGFGNIGSIRASYAASEVSGDSRIGGLVGSGSIPIHDSYFDTDTSGLTGSRGRTTAALSSPTSYTGIYANWNVDLDKADLDLNPLTGGDDPWDFGTSEQYPVLQVDFDGDGVKSWEEFGPQPRPGVFLLPGALSLTEGAMKTYTAVLQAAPTAAVTVMPMSSDSAVSVSVAGGESLTFTPENWTTAQTVTVHAVSDDDEDDETVTLSHTVVGTGNYASVTALNVEVNVEDNNAGIAVLPGTLSLAEGSTGSYTVVLLTTPTATVTVTPGSENSAAVSVNINPLTFMSGTWNTAQTVMVEAVEDDNVVGAGVSLMHTVGESSAGNYASVTASDVTVNVTDNDAPVSVSTGTLSLTEGTTGSYTVVLLGEPTTPSVTVTLMSNNTTSVRVNGALTFTDTNWDTRQTVVVEAVDDDNAVDEEVMLTHTVSESPNYASMPPPVVVTVNVEDDDGGIRVRVRVFLEGPLR